MAFTVGLKRLLFAPTITRNRGTPGPCWGLLHRDADATTAARQPARAATTTVDRQPSGMYLQLSSSHPAPSCSCRIMCAILQLNKIERRFSSRVLPGCRRDLVNHMRRCSIDEIGRALGLSGGARGVQTDGAVRPEMGPEFGQQVAEPLENFEVFRRTRCIF